LAAEIPHQKTRITQPQQRGPGVVELYKQEIGIAWEDPTDPRRSG
jgi:hypothetical protein